MQLQFVLGTAAELIKIYPLILEAQLRGWPWHALATGQSPGGFRRQWADFALPMDSLSWALDTKQDLASSGAAMKWFLRAYWTHAPMLKAKDTVVVVHGDTLSTLVGSKWASRAGLPLAHVEAGLRSERWYSPFPEELTRRWVSRGVTYHFAPDAWAAANLEKAGYHHNVFNTGGNTLADAVRLALKDESPINPESYVVVNVHRFENLNSAQRWSFIERTLDLAAEQMKLKIVMHPQTAAKMDSRPEFRQRLEARGAEFTERMPFMQFIRLLAKAQYVISDGGSNQEECHYLGKPCLLLRNESERREGLGGSCVLSHFDMALVEQFLKSPQSWSRSPSWPLQSPSRLICDTLQRLSTHPPQ